MMCQNIPPEGQKPVCWKNESAEMISSSWNFLLPFKTLNFSFLGMKEKSLWWKNYDDPYLPFIWCYHHFGTLVFGPLVKFCRFCKIVISALSFRRSGPARIKIEIFDRGPKSGILLWRWYNNIREGSSSAKDSSFSSTRKPL